MSNNPEQDQITSRLLLNRYHIIEKLGVGAFGTVFKAIDGKSGETVALKILHPGHVHLFEQTTKQDLTTRWKSLMSSIGHPNIVKIRDVHTGKDFLIVMDYVEGEPLNKILDSESPPSISRVIQIATELASAIHHLHTHAIVHGDIHPPNIIVDRNGRAVLIDLGFSELGGGTYGYGYGYGYGAYSAHSRATYVAPEVKTTGHVNAASDVYSFGAVVYRCLMRTAFEHGQVDLSVALHGADLPTWLVNLIQECLQSDPAARPSASQVLNALLVRDGDDEPIEPLVLLVDTGTAPPEFIADILSDLSLLYRASGGSGITFRFEEVLATRGDLV